MASIQAGINSVIGTAALSPKVKTIADQAEHNLKTNKVLQGIVDIQNPGNDKGTNADVAAAIENDATVRGDFLEEMRGVYRGYDEQKGQIATYASVLDQLGLSRQQKKLKDRLLKKGGIK